MIKLNGWFFVIFILLEVATSFAPAGTVCHGNHVITIRATLFQDEPEIVSIATNYVRSKYQSVAKSHGHEYLDKDDAKEVLQAILPPVSKDELDDEVSKVLLQILSNRSNSEEKITEESFIQAVTQNSYWQAAGDLVVKELMYFDSLYNYYKTGTPLLSNDDYEALKDSLSWEGSSVATMNAKEALFVTAVASARRGDSIMDDQEYENLKDELKRQGSWVTERGQDALEKHGVDTFMGYLHRSF